jgi:hypothetical protein
VVSAALAAPRRLTVPAVRTDSREILVTATPFFLRDPSAPPATSPAQPVSPPLISFDGASFMTDFLAAAADSSALPQLLAWRDWAEPPASMIDVNGAALYPASIRRATPLAIEAESEPAGVLDGDGVPRGDPAWLRKFYPPLHLRFTFVAFDVMCERLGWPRVAKSRIKEAGAVVRRLVRHAASERWEDWITVDGKRGIWFELQAGLPADPAAIPASSWGAADATEVRGRLGLPASAALPTALDSARLALLPPTVAGAAVHTTPYGLVPVFSAAEQAPDEVSSTDAATLAAALAAEAKQQLTLAWTGAAGRRGAIRQHLSDLLGLVVTPAAPTALLVSTARLNIRTVAGASDATIDTTLTGVVRTVIYDAITSKSGGGLGSTADTASFWDAAQDPGHWGSSDGAIAGSFSTNTLDWKRLIDDRLSQAIQSVLLATGAPSADAELGLIAAGLSVVAVLRVRAFRLALLSSLHSQMYGAADADQLNAVTSQAFGQLTLDIPVATAGSLSQEIEAAYGLDAVTSPPDAVPSWAPLDRSRPPGANAVHAAALALETQFAAIDAAGAVAGGAYEVQVTAMIASQAAAIAGPFHLQVDDPVHRLRSWGLDMSEQPARGILVFPGATPTDAAFASMGAAVANVYATNLPTAVGEARGRSKAHRLRYDHESLYAVWAWVRVAGRTDCENDRVVWTARSEPFSIAEPTDILGARPVTIQLPDLAKLIRDIPRIAKARAKPFAAFNTPANSGFNVGAEPKDTSRAWGVGWICSFAIPVITICAFIMFSFIFSILIILPGFAWMLLLKFCIPIPVPVKK